MKNLCAKSLSRPSRGISGPEWPQGLSTPPRGISRTHQPLSDNGPEFDERPYWKVVPPNVVMPRERES